jgi:hypothetical protein
MKIRSLALLRFSSQSDASTATAATETTFPRKLSFPIMNNQPNKSPVKVGAL